MVFLEKRYGRGTITIFASGPEGSGSPVFVVHMRCDLAINPDFTRA